MAFQGLDFNICLSLSVTVMRAKEELRTLPDGLSAEPNRPVAMALIVVSTLTVMAGATISPALPAMAKHFEAVDNADVLVRLVISTTALAIAITSPFAGALSDRVGKEKLLLGSVLLYAVAGSAGLVLADLSSLLVSRAILGIAVAGVMTSSTALIADWFHGTARAKLFGVQAAASGVGGAVFLSLGGVLSEISWRGPFAVYILALPIALLVVASLRSRPPAQDESPSSTGEATARSTSAAMIGVLVVAFVTQIIFYAVPTQLPFHLANIASMNASGIGLVIGGMVLIQALSSLAYRWVSAYPFPLIAALSLSSMAVGMFITAITPTVAGTLTGLTISALGVGLVMPNLNSWIVSLVPPSARATWIGALVSAIFLGQFASPILAGPLVTDDSVRQVFGAASALAGLTAIALLLALCIRSITARRLVPALAPADVK
jgi:MFS family permease